MMDPAGMRPTIALVTSSTLSVFSSLFRNDHMEIIYAI